MLNKTRKMLGRLYAVILLLSFAVVFQTAASADEVSTLDALPAWSAPHAVFHLEDISATASRLAASFWLDARLDTVPEREAILEWLRSFPLSSVSLVKGTMLGDEERFQGALCFKPDLGDQAFWELLANGKELDDNFANKLFGLPEDENLREKIKFSVERSGDEKNLYKFDLETSGWLYDIVGDWEFMATAEKIGDEYLLLIGSSTEDLKKAGDALKAETALTPEMRMKIERYPNKARQSPLKSFVQLKDDAKNTMTRDLGEGLSFFSDFEPKAPVFLELSFGQEDASLKFSLQHNLFEVFCGKANPPKTTLSLNDPGLKFGGGAPWLAGIGGLLLTEDQALELLRTFTEGRDISKEEVSEALKSQNIDLKTIVEAIRTFGVVLGGRSSWAEKNLPGGYVFISGEPMKMKALIPLIKNIIGLSLEMEEMPRLGWNLFYRPNISEVPFFIGMKDGVLLAGKLNPDSQETEPLFKWPEASSTGLFLVHANTDALNSIFLDFFSLPPAENLRDFLSLFDLDDLEPMRFSTYGSQFFLMSQEINGVTLAMSDWETLDLTISTREVDYKKLYELQKGLRRAVMKMLRYQ